MGLFSRTDAMPAEIRRALPLSPGDSALASALLRDGGWVVATQHTLVFVAAPDPEQATLAPPTSWPWCQVDRASWDPESASLTVRWVDTAAPLPLHLVHPERTTFARVFRERVQYSVILAETVHLPDGLSARVAVRRDASGDLFTQVVPDPGADVRSARSAQLIRSALSRLRSTSGAPPEA
ncbi:hypothetical protein SAMN05216410_2851 [Sanguibacter gelidistatuariae]|uniref:Uncharacterized protein n=1 Tax=Sanguibacter gelidistatuariae TaxID=1814289 RepID=A0A1G6S1U0_9MICO|nr:hypothetical protein [Sanguibacter gelidistatuariae]SDD10882.1 hypothetical protein SAMN05216410_2851 [Sanguibacter gelidistatuariae]